MLKSCSCLQTHYLRRTMKKMIYETDGENKLTTEQFWTKFDTLKALWIMDEAWKEISHNQMNATWKKLSKRCSSFEGFLETERAVRRNFVKTLFNSALIHTGLNYFLENDCLPDHAQDIVHKTKDNLAPYCKILC